MEDFVSYEIAVKLKEKGFTIPTKLIFGMYNEIGVFHTLTTSADYNTCDSGFKCRCYYNYDDFDERDFIAPTISQVLKWLRKEKRIDAGALFDNRDGKWVGYVNEMDMPDLVGEYILPNTYDSYELAAISVIEYIIDNNLI